MPPAYILPTKYILFALSAEVSISPLHSGHKQFSSNPPVVVDNKTATNAARTLKFDIPPLLPIWITIG